MWRENSKKDQFLGLVYLILNARYIIYTLVKLCFPNFAISVNFMPLLCLSNFAMGTIWEKGFAQAQVRTNHSTY